MGKKKITNLNEEFDAKLFTIILRKNFQWLILLLTVSLLTAFLYLRYTHLVYQANSTLKIGMIS